MAERTTTTTEKIDEKLGEAGSALQNAASTLHKKADQMPGGPKVSDLAHAAAEKLDEAGVYVEEHDTREILQDLQSIIKRRPVQSMLIAVGLGFLVGHAFRTRS